MNRDGSDSDIIAADLGMLWELKEAQNGAILLTKNSLVGGHFFFDPNEPVNYGYVVYDSGEASAGSLWHVLRQNDVGLNAIIWFGDLELRAA